MARGIDRIWLRFALAIAGAVVVTLVVQVGTIALYQHLEHDQFVSSLPQSVQAELERLEEADDDDDPRVWEIYRQYWRGGPWGSDLAAILAGLLSCLLWAC